MIAALSADHARNNFDFLRIVAATAVLVDHQFPVQGLAQWMEPHGYAGLGGTGVFVFFTMSGFLVCQSWQRDPNVVRFAIRRLLRLWPALAVAVVLTVCVLGPALTTLPLRDYVADPDTIHYFGILRFHDAGHLAGLFDANPNPIVNASLWTLPMEVLWYQYLVILGLLGFLRWRVLLLVGTIAMAVHYFVVLDAEHVILAGGKRNSKEELGLYFLAGACVQCYRVEWRARRVAVRIAASVFAIAAFATGYHHAAYWIALVLVTMEVALASWWPLNRAGHYGDLSYGVYIYAFPVQQTIAALTNNGLDYFEGLAASLVVTFFFAWCSWHLVEARALRLKPSKATIDIGWDRLAAWFSARRRATGTMR